MPDGTANNEKMDDLVKRIDAGLHDGLLGWETEAYKHSKLSNQLIDKLVNPNTNFVNNNKQ